MFKEQEPEFESIKDDEPNNEKGKDKPKDTVFYKEFKEKEYKKGLSGLKIDAGEEKEKAMILENLDKQLEKESPKEQKKQKKEILKQRFTEISPILKPGKLWIEANVAGETHNISFSSLEIKGKTEKPQDVAEKLNKEEIKPEEILVNFALKSTKGRPENLNLNFKTSLSTMLEGGGNIEGKLQNLITEQFAGTDHHYKTMAAEKAATEKLATSPEQMDEFQKGKTEIKDALQKTGSEVSELEGAGLYSIIAKMPQSEEQIHISNTNGRATWNVALVEKDQKNIKEQTNLKPQEIISQYIEKAK